MDTQTPMTQTQEVQGFLEKNLTTLITLASFASAIAIIFLVGYPRFSALKEARTQVDAQSQKTAAMTAKLNGLKTLDEEKLIADATLLKTAVPSDKDITGLVIGLQQMASQNSLSITQFSATPGNLGASALSAPTPDPSGAVQSVAGPQAAAGGTTIDFTVTFRGDYSALENLLKASTETLRLISVKTAKIAPSSGAGSIDMLLSAKAYWKSPGDLGNYADPLPTLGSNAKVVEALAQYKILSGQPQPLPTGSVTSPF